MQSKHADLVVKRSRPVLRYVTEHMSASGQRQLNLIGDAVKYLDRVVGKLITSYQQLGLLVFHALLLVSVGMCVQQFCDAMVS